MAKGRDGRVQGGGFLIEMTMLSILHSAVSQRRMAFGLSANGCYPVPPGAGKERPEPVWRAKTALTDGTRLISIPFVFFHPVPNDRY